MEIRGVDLVNPALATKPGMLRDCMKLIPRLEFQYLSATLKSNGYACRIYDQQVLMFTPEELFDLLNRNPKRAACFYSDFSLKQKALSMIGKLRELGWKKPILVLDPGEDFDAEFLDAGADFVFVGEAEKTILEVLEFLNGKKDEADLLGISYAKDGKKIKTPPQQLIKNLDEICFPDRDDYPIETYYDLSLFAFRSPYAPMLASRKGSRQRSFENCLAEIDLLTGRYDLKFIDFQDENFGASRPWLDQFCEGLIQRQAPIHFHCKVSPDSFKDRRSETAGLLYRSGCRQITVTLDCNRTDVEEQARQQIELVHILKQKGIMVVAERKYEKQNLWLVVRRNPWWFLCVLKKIRCFINVLITKNQG